MNFVTFNQDYSHLAVGTYGEALEEISVANTSPRYLKRLPDIYHRPFLKMLRVKTRRYCTAGDAVLNIFGCPDTFTTKATNHEYQSTSLLPRAKWNAEQKEVEVCDAGAFRTVPPELG